MAHLIQQVGRGYTSTAATSHKPTDSVEGQYYMDINLRFGLCWAVASCQEVTSLVVKHLSKHGLHLLKYIDVLGGGGATAKAEATRQFLKLCATLHCLCLAEAEHKASSHSQDMV